MLLWVGESASYLCRCTVSGTSHRTAEYLYLDAIVYTVCDSVFFERSSLTCHTDVGHRCILEMPPMHNTRYLTLIAGSPTSL